MYCMAWSFPPVESIQDRMEAAKADSFFFNLSGLSVHSTDCTAHCLHCLGLGLGLGGGSPSGAARSSRKNCLHCVGLGLELRFFPPPRVPLKVPVKLVLKVREDGRSRKEAERERRSSVEGSGGDDRGGRSRGTGGDEGEYRQAEGACDAGESLEASDLSVGSLGPQRGAGRLQRSRV
jgi:hypothetical protein